MPRLVLLAALALSGLTVGVSPLSDPIASARVASLFPAVEALVAPGAAEASIAVDPLDASRAVLGLRRGASTSFHSGDGGNVWKASTDRISGIGDDFVSFDSARRAYHVALGYSGAAGVSSVEVSRSLDGGRTFEPVAAAMHAGTTFRLPDGGTRALCPQSPFDYPKVGADTYVGSPHRNHVYVIAIARFANHEGTCDNQMLPVVVRSLDAGLTWSSGQVLGAPLVDSNGTTFDMGRAEDVVAGPDGFVHVAAISQRTCGGGIALARSRDGGATFEAPRCTGRAGISPALATHPTDPDRLYLAFQALVPALGNTFHVFATASVDGGESWSEAIRLDDAGTRHAEMPAIDVAVDAQGPRIAVAWFDGRNNPSGGRSVGDVYYAAGREMALFGPNVRLTREIGTAFVHGNDYLSIASLPDRDVVAYGHERNGTWAVYVSQVAAVLPGI